LPGDRRSEIIEHVMRRRLATFLSLPSSDRRLLMRAATAVAAARVMVKLMPLRTARGALVGSQRRLRAAPSNIACLRPPAERIIWAVEAAGRAIPGGGNCLVQALAAEALMLRAGYACDLRIGVARDGARNMAAHAWLVAPDGKVLIGDFDLDRYRPMASTGRP
jgi:hypothetical protein